MTHIVIEGCECSGKSTLHKQFRKLTCFDRTFPSRVTSYGREARHMLTSEKFNPVDMAMLCILDQRTIDTQPNKLNRKTLLVDDRGALSTLVYASLEDQSLGEVLYSIVRKCLPKPDLLIYLDTPLKTVNDRLKKREYFNYYDRKDLQVAIKAKYEYWLERFSDWNILRVEDSTTLDIEAVLNELSNK